MPTFGGDLYVGRYAPMYICMHACMYRYRQTYIDIHTCMHTCTDGSQKTDLTLTPSQFSASHLSDSLSQRPERARLT